MAEKHPRDDVGGAEAMRCRWPARDPGRAPAGSVDCVAHVLPHRGDRFSRGKARHSGNKQGTDGLEILMRLPRSVCVQALGFMTGDQILTVSHFLPGELCEAFCQRRLKRLTEQGCDTWVTDDGGDCLARTNNTFFFFEAFQKRVKSNLKNKTDTLFPGAKKDAEPYLASIESETKQISARLSPETPEYEATNSDLYQDAQTPLAAMIVKLPWTQLFVANQLFINAIDESMSHETFHESEDLFLAAMLGHPLAQFEIAVSYMRASEVLVPTFAYERCIFWLLQSVDVLPRAQFCLATALNFAEEQLRPPTKRFPVSCQTIFNLYSAAAKKDHPSACVNVGMIYHGDFPFLPDSIGLSDFQSLFKPKLAMEYWMVASHSNQVESILNLGHMYYTGISTDGFSLKKDTKQALVYWKMAADMNDCRGHYLFAAALELGVGCTKNIECAIDHYEKAFMHSFGECNNTEIRQQAYEKLNLLVLNFAGLLPGVN